MDYSSSWISSKYYQSELNRRFTGEPTLHWFMWTIANILNVGDTADKTCLILGSNEGWMEIALRQAGFAGRIVASDIADKALERARRRIADLGLTGIEHRVADLNKDMFPANSFDFVVAEGVLHHIENIDFCMANLRAALKPGGRLVGMEFVGAFRFQFPERQVRWINAALDVVPTKFRPSFDGQDPARPPSDAMRAVVHYVPPSVEAMIAFDPSEAISGHLLMDALRKYFVIETLRPGGGGLVMNMGGHFPFAQTNTDPECAAWLAIMADIERRLYEQDIVPSDLVLFVAG